MSTSDHKLALPFENSHAFIIGIDDYEHISPLTTAINDATALADKLAKDHGYDVYPPLLNATKAEMERLFTEVIPQISDERDRLLFYFAGHGIALNSDDDPQGYFVPVDARPEEVETLVSMDLLHDSLNALPCKHGMLIMDCCFAGSFKWSSNFRDVLFDLPSVIYEERFFQYAKDAAWQVITSSASDQKAVDILSNRTLGMRGTVAGESKHSPFAQALLDGLDGEADTIPKEEGDGVITATELYSYLRDRVEDETMDHGMRQSPSFFSLSKHDKGQYIFLHPNHRLNLPPIPKRNPYMGLSSYNEDDSNLYFGRERVIDELEKLAERSKLIVISGASGTGKSSAIKAGMIPRLRSKGWDILPVIRPGQEPMKSLMMEIPDMGDFLNGNRPAMLLIDQYEELITQCLDPNERIDFENLLSFWVQSYPQLRIVISLRSDFEPQFIEGPLAPWWFGGHYAVPTFSQDELRSIIVKPTIQEVLFFEPEALVDKLMDAVNQAPGALPLLSFTLSELYHAYLNSGRTNRAFTLEDYEKLGGVIGALHTRANAVYDGLDKAHQRSMQMLMLRMVSLEGGDVASRRVLEKDLEFVDPKETERVQHVAQLLVDARLVTTGRDKHGRTFYEPAHDALVRAWGRLWDWIKAIGEDTLSLMYKLRLAIDDYEEHRHSGKAKSYLWNEDPRLSLMIADLQSGDHHFNAEEEAFLYESLRKRTQKGRIKQVLVGAAMGILLLLSVASFSMYRIAEAEKTRALIAIEEAQANYTQAEIEAEKAIRASIKAIEAKEEAEAHEKEALKMGKVAAAALIRKEAMLLDMELTSESMVGLILEDAKQDIKRLRYEEALGKYRKAFTLKKRKQQVAIGMMELSFFYGEMGEIQLAKGLLDTVAILLGNRNIAISAQADIRSALFQIDSLRYRDLYHRYYPQMVAADMSAVPDSVTHPSIYMSKSEISVWQYHLFARAQNREMVDKPLWGHDGRFPVIGVTMEDVDAYSEWLSTKTQQRYHLPDNTETVLITRDTSWLTSHLLVAPSDYSPEAIKKAGFHLCQDVANSKVGMSDTRSSGR